MARLLLIDDDEAFRTMLRRTLQRAGHAVAEAEDGAAALRSLAHSDIDVVITDIVMPDMDGIEVIRELRRSYPSVRIVAVSGGGRVKPEGYLEVARVLGAARVLSKPFESAELLAAIDDALREGGGAARM